jgi:mRNA interferase MazF
VWWAEADDARRPVLVLTRSVAVERLNRVVVAPITRTIRGIATEVPVGSDVGLTDEGVASFDNITVLPLRRLTDRVGRIDFAGRRICDALAAMADC